MPNRTPSNISTNPTWKTPSAPLHTHSVKFSMTATTISPRISMVRAKVTSMTYRVASLQGAAIITRLLAKYEVAPMEGHVDRVNPVCVKYGRQTICTSTSCRTALTDLVVLL